ncbi:MAG: hypothetical protein R2759_18250 [Bacteroidales bacterium]
MVTETTPVIKFTFHFKPGTLGVGIAQIETQFNSLIQIPSDGMISISNTFKSSTTASDEY